MELYTKNGEKLPPEEKDTVKSTHADLSGMMARALTGNPKLTHELTSVWPELGDWTRCKTF